MENEVKSLETVSAKTVTESYKMAEEFHLFFKITFGLSMIFPSQNRSFWVQKPFIILSV